MYIDRFYVRSWKEAEREKEHHRGSWYFNRPGQSIFTSIEVFRLVSDTAGEAPEPSSSTRKWEQGSMNTEPIISNSRGSFDKSPSLPLSTKDRVAFST